MSLQDVRGQVELVTATALQNAGVAADAVIFDNTKESRPSLLPAATIAVTFTRVHVDSVGFCPGGEAITGTVLVNVITDKQIGSKPGEDIATAVICGWSDQNRRRLNDPTGATLRIRFRAVEGPTTVTLGDVGVPVHTHVVTAGFTARTD